MLGAVLSAASPLDFDVLLVHHIPGQLVRCLAEADQDPGLQTASLSVHAMASMVHPLGRSWKQVRHFPVLSALTQPIDAGKTESPRRGRDEAGLDIEADDLFALSGQEEHEESLGWRDKQEFETRRDLRARVLNSSATALLEPRRASVSVLSIVCGMFSEQAGAVLATPTQDETGASTRVPPSPTTGHAHGHSLGLVAACLRVLLHTARASPEAARFISAHAKAVNASLALVELPGPTSEKGEQQQQRGDGFCQGLILLLFAALQKHRTMPNDQSVRVVHAASRALCESQDIRISAAAVSVLASSLSLSRLYSQSENDPEDSWKKVAEHVLRVAASPACIAGVRRLLCFQSASWLELVEARRLCGGGDQGRGEGSQATLDRHRMEDVDGTAAHLEGSEFGGRSSGILDDTVIFLADAVALYPALASKVVAGRLWQPLCRQLATGGNGELSPEGTLAALGLLKALLESTASLTGTPPVDLYEQLASEGVLALFSALLHPSHLRALKRWPLENGGGVRGVTELLVAVCAVVRLPLPPQICPRDVLVKWQHSIFTDNLINGILVSLRAVAKRLDTPPPHLPIDLLSRLVLLSSNFLLQFMGLQGFSTLRDSDAFSPTSPAKVIVNALLIACQAARASEAHYRSLHEQNLYMSVFHLLGHGDGSVRAKACNFLGNLCRHSCFFYKTLITPLTDFPPRTAEPTGPTLGRLSAVPAAVTACESGASTLLERLVARCGDEDPATRKFACFAVGNAAFHSAVLYPHLKGAIPLLVAAMKDSDEKTRANAAGAIGNLVRNSSELSTALARANAVWSLLDVAMSDTAVTPRRIALFSLGTLAVYAPCRKSIDQLDPPLLVMIDDLERGARRPSSPDSQVLDHLSRIRKKLSQEGIP